jgi:hypothetical protein
MTTAKHALTVGARVRVVNYHGEQIPASHRLGTGVVRDFYMDGAERRAYVLFPKAMKCGGWPVEMLRVVTGGAK